MADLEELRMMAKEVTALARSNAENAQHQAAYRAAESEAYAMLSRAEWQAGDFDAAEYSLNHALSSSPSGGLQLRRAVMLPKVPRSRAEIETVRANVAQRLTALQGRPATMADLSSGISGTLFLLAYHGEHENLGLHRLFHQVCSRIDPKLDWIAPHCSTPRRPGRPRVGFISWHFREHTISRLFSGLLQAFDAEAFDVTIFSFEGQDDAIAATPLPGKRCISLVSDIVAAHRAIAAQELDLLIYLDLGMDYFTLFLAHARLARRQGVLWGHPDTTGLPHMDFFFSPACMEADEGESHYSERLIRLPGATVVYPRPNAPSPLPSRQDLNLPSQGVLYLCPQTPYKFHPDFDGALARILDGTPGSHLILTAGWEEEAMALVKKRITGHAPNLADRIHILGPLDRPNFLAVLCLCDVVLDPFHYSGGHTTLEAFACARSVVTWPGKFMRASHTAGFYRLMELADNIAEDHDHYVDLAVRLGTDPCLRQAFGERIRAASPVLYGNTDGVRALERFILDELRNWDMPAMSPKAMET